MDLKLKGSFPQAEGSNLKLGNTGTGFFSELKLSNLVWRFFLSVWCWLPVLRSAFWLAFPGTSWTLIPTPLTPGPVSFQRP